MTSREIAFILVAGLLVVSCGARDDALPQVHNPPSLGPKPVCFEPPLGIAMERPILTHPTDPAHCFTSALAAIIGRPSLPVRLRVSPAGHVVEVAFYDPCSGLFVDVDRATAACVRTSLAEWRFAPDPEACPRLEYIPEQYLELALPAPTDAAQDHRVARWAPLAAQRECSADIDGVIAWRAT